MELKDRMVMTETTEPLDNTRRTLFPNQHPKSAARAIRRPDLPALLDQRDPMASLEMQEPLEHPRPAAEALELLEPLDPLVDLDLLDPRDPLEPPDNNNPVELDPLVNLEPQVPRELKDPLDPMVNQEKEAALVPQDPLAQLDQMASLEAMDNLDQQALLVELVLLAAATTAHRHDWRLDIKNKNGHEITSSKIFCDYFIVSLKTFRCFSLKNFL